MTKGSAVLPATVVAEQDPLFFALTSPVEMTKGGAVVVRRSAKQRAHPSKEFSITSRVEA
jgi:hypothetical protein